MTVLKRLTIQANKYKAILRHVSPCIHGWSEKIKSWKIVKIFRQFLNDVTAAEFRTGGGGWTNLEVVQKIIRFDIRGGFPINPGLSWPSLSGRLKIWHHASFSQFSKGKYSLYHRVASNFADWYSLKTIQAISDGTPGPNWKMDDFSRSFEIQAESRRIFGSGVKIHSWF